MIINQPLTLWGPAAPHDPQDFYAAELLYSAGDPFAVWLEQEHPAGGPPIAWAFARDLLIEALHLPIGTGPQPLAEALTRPAGLGDVQLAATDSAEWVAVILIPEPDAPLTLFASRAVLTDFAERTLALVPAGAAEAIARRDLDTWLAQVAL